SLLEVGTGFHPEMTGKENIFMNGSIMGMTKSEIKRKFDEIVDFAGIERYLDSPVKRYSSGMTVRLGFSIAAHLEPDILVVDEVLAVGDAEFQKKAIGKMQDVSKGEGRTVLFVSHNMGAIKSLCKNCVLLENGGISYIGNVENAISNYLVKNSTNITNITKIENRTDREGNGKFRFTDIKLLDKNNNEISEILTGETLKIKLFYKNEKEIEINKMIFDISVKNSYNDFIFQFISDEIGYVFKENAENSITLVIPELLLRGGNYYIRLFATYKNTEKFNNCDNIENAATLIVISSDLWNSGKIIRSTNYAVNKGYFLS
ncbi:MAG: Wzt carbohydrate-binding domain-containing protein, partial [Bacteroidales bacterium]|nr:Wzt carbohydrate-binding domain-containing protein [Bacteroidales bacterium]